MLQSVVELLGGLLLSALTLLMGSCVVGSIVAALVPRVGRSVAKPKPSTTVLGRVTWIGSATL